MYPLEKYIRPSNCDSARSASISLSLRILKNLKKHCVGVYRGTIEGPPAHYHCWDDNRVHIFPVSSGSQVLEYGFHLPACFMCIADQVANESFSHV